jgi:hypothetical protein
LYWIDFVKYFTSFSLAVSTRGWTKAINFGIVWQVFYHSATAAGLITNQLEAHLQTRCILAILLSDASLKQKIFYVAATNNLEYVGKRFEWTSAKTL